MLTAPLTAYLRTSYRPDREYVDGTIVERNVGLEVQAELVHFFRERRETWKTHALALRVQVAARRIRVPDVCVFVGYRPRGPIPLRYVWVINPRSRRVWVHTAAGTHEAKDGILRTENPAFEVRPPELFAELDA